MALVTPQGSIPEQSAPQAESMAPANEAAPPVEKKELLSPHYAKFAIREKEIRRMNQEFQAEKAEFKAREADYIPKSALAQNTRQVLLDAGLSHEQISQLALDQPSAHDQTIQELRAEVNSLKDSFKQNSTKQEEQRTQAYEDAISQIRNDTGSFVGEKEEYDVIRGTESHEAVVDLIRETYEKTKNVLSIEEATKQVQSNIRDQVVKYAKIPSIWEALKAEWAQEQQKPETHPLAQKSQSPTQPNQIKTLTNAQNASSSKPLTAEERRQRAILAYKGQLQP